MTKHYFYFGLIGCALCVAAGPSMAGPSKADLEKALSACPPGQTQGQDGLCAPAQGDQMGYDFIPQGDTAPGAATTSSQSTMSKPMAAPVHHTMHRGETTASLERPGAVDKGFADLQMTFTNGSWAMTASDRETADTLAQVLLEPGYTDKLAEIGGHTSNTGSAAFNEVLSQKRAEAVKQYLVDKGVPADRLKAVGYGFSQPIEGTDPSSGENRRVVLTVLGSKQSQ